MNKTNNSRNIILDVIKGIAISLVALGHCIQYGTGASFLNNNMFFDNIPFKIIYSFHMPLFMLISGYFFFFSIRKYSLNVLLMNRFTKLIIPIFVWNGLFFAALFISKYHAAHKVDLINEILRYVKSSFTTLWFLWAIIYSSFAVIIINKLFNDNIFIYILVLIVTLLLPDSMNISLYGFMYPYFIIGYFFCKNKNKITEYLFKFNESYLLVSVTALYIILMLFFNYDSFIYTTGYSIIGKNIPIQLLTNIYRFVVGLVGSALVILLFNYLFNRTANKSKWMLITKLGVDSLGIYIISGYIIIILPKLTVGLSFNYLVVVLEVIFIMSVSYFITILLKKFKITNTLLLGGKWDFNPTSWFKVAQPLPEKQTR